MSHWWYKVRRKMILDMVRAHFPGRHDLKILDVGCGTGGLMNELVSFGEITGVDVSEKALNFCRSRGITNVHVGSGTHIPFPDNSFDLVLTLDVIEHIEDDRAAIAEIHRVLKPGGVSIVFVPAFMFLWGITDILSQHFRRYTKMELEEKLSNGGFHVIRLSYFNTFLFPPIALLRRTVRLFKITMKSENELKLGNAFIDRIFYGVFRFESMCLRVMNFPFGVSALAVSKKPATTVS